MSAPSARSHAPSATAPAQTRAPRNRRSEIVLAVGWALVLAKCLTISWAIRAYSVPIHPWWLIGPTLAFAALCTWLYWRRD